jgi:hypothetical protein
MAETVSTVPPQAPALLRLGLAACFIGHGTYGVLTKAAWVPYFAVVEIGEDWAWRLMPWVGAMDIALGFLALTHPCRALFAWTALWALWTALLRPLAGEPFWETLERAGNYGVPLVLLLAAGWKDPPWTRVSESWRDLDPAGLRRCVRGLQLTTATLLAGHAGLGLIVVKPGLVCHYAALGLPHPAAVARGIGAFEFVLAVAVLVAARPALLVTVAGWKLATESLFLIGGTPAPLFEVIERGGSYAAPLALALLQLPPVALPPHSHSERPQTPP